MINEAQLEAILRILESITETLKMLSSSTQGILELIKLQDEMIKLLTNRK